MALSESLPGSLGPSPAHSIQENRKEKKQTESKKNTSAIKIKRLSGFTTRLKFISLLCLEFVCLSVCVCCYDVGLIQYCSLYKSASALLFRGKSFSQSSNVLC